MALSRRSWLKSVAAGGMGLTAASGFEHLIPALVAPDNTVPGVATWFATTCRECPAGCGMLVRVRENRPVKCEGNPDHPINRGKLCARGQAALQGLYDPDRPRGPARREASGAWVPTTWESALSSLGAVLARVRPGRVAVMTDLQTGALAALLRGWLACFGSDRFVRYEPISLSGVRAASEAVYGISAVPWYDISGCDLVLSLGADFLDTWLSPVSLANGFGRMRDPDSDSRPGRIVCAGPRIGTTQAMADVRYLTRPGQETLLGLGVLHAVANELPAGERRDALARVAAAYGPEEVGPLCGVSGEEIQALGQAFVRARQPVALGGDGDAALVAALLNAAVETPAVDLGTPHALTESATPTEVEALLRDMADGELDLLIVCGANPAYALADFAAAAEAVPTIVSLSTARDETSELADWLLPTHHPLESWGDYEPRRGSRCLCQPTLSPLWDTMHAADVFLGLARAAQVSLPTLGDAGDFHEFLRARWRPVLTRDGADDGEFETAWREAVRVGGRFDHAADPLRPALAPKVASLKLAPAVAEGLCLLAVPSVTLYDGRGANKSWLQELPDPITKLVWGSWVELHTQTAADLGIQTGDVLRVITDAGDVEAAAYVWDGIAAGVAAIPLGQGHTSYGRAAAGVGVNVLPLLPQGRDWCAASIALTTRRDMPVTPQGSDSQHGRPIVQLARYDELAGEAPDLALPLPEGYQGEHGDMYPPVEPRGHRWAMTVDLTRCSGCGACVVACYAENNIATVGRDQVARGREMAWIRIDRYFDWSSVEAPVLFQPMLCQQCDSAPCEAVCPTFASVHSNEGINAQVYNRCVGTRYCANNCPYKTRRFNWFDHSWPPPLDLQLNPDVTVRCRGVMEKCTFCIQRVREVQHRARAEGRSVRDGEVQPACVQTCPTGALAFGDLLDPSTRVSAIVRRNRRAYQVLRHLNTKPGVIYLKRVIV